MSKHRLIVLWNIVISFPYRINIRYIQNWKKNSINPPLFPLHTCFGLNSRFSNRYQVSKEYKTLSCKHQIISKKILNIFLLKPVDLFQNYNDFCNRYLSEDFPLSNQAMKK